MRRIPGTQGRYQIRAAREAGRVARHALRSILQITLRKANGAGQSMLHLRLVVIFHRPEGAGSRQQASENSRQKTQHEQSGAQPRKTTRDNSHG